MAFVLSDGVRIYWEEQGSGPPVLLIMGLSFTHDMWFRVLPSLSSDYRAILLDNRGMGRSEVPRGPYSIRQMARDAVAVLDAAGVRTVHVVGASMGGMIAQELALEHPNRVLSLVLGCTTFSGLLGKWPNFRKGRAEIFRRNATREQRERALRTLLYAKNTAAQLIEEDLQVRARCVWSYKGFWNQFAGILMWNSYRRLPQIKVPTLVIHGDEDHLVPSQNGRTIARRIPGARFHLVRGAGHILITDQPKISTELLLEFLVEQTGVRNHQPNADDKIVRATT